MERETALWRRVWLCTGRLGVGDAGGSPWAGFGWAQPDGSAVSLDDFLAPVHDVVDAEDLASWQTERAVTTEIACNWKASVDAHNESYHVPALHPEIGDLVDVSGARIRLLGPHADIRVPMRDGATNHLIYIFPNVQFNLFADHGMAFRHRPHASDPERCFFDMFVLRRGGTTRMRDVAAVNVDDPVFGPVTGADIAMLPRLQAGMRSPGFAGLLLGEREACIRHMHAQLDRYLADT